MFLKVKFRAYSLRSGAAALRRPLAPQFLITIPTDDLKAKHESEYQGAKNIRYFKCLRNCNREERDLYRKFTFSFLEICSPR